MATDKTVAYVLKGMCLLWRREFDAFVLDVYCDVCAPFTDEIVRLAAKEMAKTSEWFPMPKEFRRLMETMAEMDNEGRLEKRKAIPNEAGR